eukprot:Hpha_TRINITY_DN19563_c0_g1::TRINITY_DN19563_c0_g1_i1::g.33626::m.33626/K15109/SLC25A20_29, CACT, CACL, CRC1; solute carrier family 25 (mitochondrial carnitine/acylcarnitine transporter), member 20/29
MASQGHAQVDETQSQLRSDKPLLVSNPGLKLGCELVAGAVGGMAGVFAGQPLDMVKVRMQVAGQTTGVLRTMRGVIRNEGFLSLYKGMFAPMVGMCGCSALCFASYGAAERLLQKRQDEYRMISGQQSISLGRGLRDVFFAGFLSCVLAVPFTSSADLAKSQLIMQRNRVGEAARYAGPKDVFAERWKTLGLRGVTQGLGMSYIRDCQGYGWYFLAFEGVKYYLGARSSVLMPSSTTESGLRDLPAVLLAGGCAGVACYVMTQPFDVLRSRIQTLPIDTPPEQKTIRAVFRQGMQEHGPKFLLSGMGASLQRSFALNMACCC